MKRGAEYEEIKNRIGKRIWEQTCELFPQIRDKVDFFDVGSPLSNRYGTTLFIYISLEYIFTVRRLDFAGRQARLKRVKGNTQLTPWYYALQCKFNGLHSTSQSLIKAGFTVY